MFILFLLLLIPTVSAAAPIPRDIYFKKPKVALRNVGEVMTAKEFYGGRLLLVHYRDSNKVEKAIVFDFSNNLVTDLPRGSAYGATECGCVLVGQNGGYDIIRWAGKENGLGRVGRTTTDERIGKIVKFRMDPTGKYILAIAENGLTFGYQSEIGFTLVTSRDTKGNSYDVSVNKDVLLVKAGQIAIKNWSVGGPPAFSAKHFLAEGEFLATGKFFDSSKVLLGTNLGRLIVVDTNRWEVLAKYKPFPKGDGYFNIHTAGDEALVSFLSKNGATKTLLYVDGDVWKPKFVRLKGKVLSTQSAIKRVYTFYNGQLLIYERR